MRRALRLHFFCVSILVFATSVTASPPRSLDDQVTIELFAESPQIRTPTGLDILPDGRVIAIESNTHFPLPGYDGPPTDRVLILDDTDDDGRADDITVFAEDLTHSMSVVVRPVWMPVVRLNSKQSIGDASAVDPEVPLQVFLATRNTLWLLEDTTGDHRCDKRTKLAWLETEGNYPHNGLAGIAFDPVGGMFFGFGENLGVSYKLFSREIAAEESMSPFTGEGEGGNIYRMQPDGTGLTHWATGFWNPHGNGFDAFGNLFDVDNDPDSRPPCRLLHVIPGADFGYRFRNGRKGLHPFTSWNGEVPGTLPMVAGTGEAPSGLLAYEHAALPEDYLGRLFVTSWGDHRIDTFELKPRGASFESLPEPLIVGDQDFRPVGIALAPDGSLYCTDWVKQDYNVHGEGRIWRIRPTDRSRLVAGKENSTNPADSDSLQQRLESPLLATRRQAARESLSTAEDARRLAELVVDSSLSERARSEAAFALASIDQRSRSSFEKGDEFQLQLNPEQMLDFGVMVFHRAGLDFATLPFDGQAQDATDTFRMMLLTQLVARTSDGKTGPALSQFRRSLLQYPGMGGMLADPWNATAERFLEQIFETQDPFELTALVGALQRDEVTSFGHPLYETEAGREVQLLTLRRTSPQGHPLLNDAFQDDSPDVRRLAVQWVAEEQLNDLRPRVEEVLRSQPMTSELFLATLAALEMLDGKVPAEFERAPASRLIRPLLTEDSVPPEVLVQAMRLVDPHDRELPVERLSKLSRADDAQVAIEAVRTLAQRADSKSTDALLAIVKEAAESSETASPVLFAEAVLGLANVANEDDQQRVLQTFQDLFLNDAGKLGMQVKLDPWLAREVVRSVRGWSSDPLAAEIIQRYQESALVYPSATAPIPREIHAQAELAMRSNADESSPTEGHVRSAERWRELLRTSDANASAPLAAVDRGRLVFFHPQGPGCGKCHTVDGRGGRIGPNLSRIGAAMTREKLIDSILEPSREVSPQYTNWSIVTDDGVVENGMIVFENQGKTTLGKSDGTTVTLDTESIDIRRPQTVSVMPADLHTLMTEQEFRDLLEFLTSLE